MNNHGRPRSRTYRNTDTSGQEWGSDHIADVVKAYGFEFVSYNPGASFRGIEESIVNYNDNVPKTIQTQNEALSVSIAHGYAKATGDPALCILHDTVGTLNGSMSIFNAYVDRVPVVMLSGNGPLRKSKRRPWIDWIHSNLNQGELIDNFVKWYDQPVDSEDVADSVIRGYNIANTMPKGPVYVTLDHDLQENELEAPIDVPDFEQYPVPTKISPDETAIEETAETLLSAEFPVILVDRVGKSRQATDSLVDLAETLGAPVIESRLYHPSRYNFPNTHPLNLSETGIHRKADAVLALDVASIDHLLKDVVDSATHETREIVEGEFDLITIGSQTLETSSLVHDYCELRESKLSILADTELAIPALVEALDDRLDGNASTRERIDDRKSELAAVHGEQQEQWNQQLEDSWSDSPVSLPRLTHELWDVIQNDSWVIVNGTLRGWPFRLWEIDEFDKYIGGTSGGAGIGYGIGAAIGGALAYENSDRVPINLQTDGDLMQFLSGLWTIARYDVPVFTVMHNNRSLYNSTEHRLELADYRGRDASIERALIGTGVDGPVPDYANIAESFGIAGYGPIVDPSDLNDTLDEAWDVAREGKPVLVDVVCQPR